MEFGFHALPVGFGEAPEVQVVAGEVFEACQVEGCGAVVAGWGVELGEVVGDLLHGGFLFWCVDGFYRVASAMMASTSIMSIMS